MSRIYSALKVLDEARAARLGAPPSDATPKIATPAVSSVAVMEREPEPEPEPEPAAAEPKRTVIQFPSAPTCEPDAEYRTVSLRVAEGPLLPFDGSDPRTAEQYRLIRTNLMLHPSRPKMIAVSSASPGDGKTVTTVNLSAALALKSESTVIMVDGDMRQKKLAISLGIKAEPGLADVLRGTCRLDEAIVRIEEMPNLLVLPSGSTTANPAELLDSPEWKALTTRLRALFSYVVIDTTPVAAVADFQLVQQASDGVLLVLRPDHTKRSIFQRALQNVPSQKLLGTVLNAVPDWFLCNTRENDYYYTEGHEGAPKGSKSSKK
jgi:capsular exopolysaccharide synthesis family protein